MDKLGGAGQKDIIRQSVQKLAGEMVKDKGTPGGEGAATKLDEKEISEEALNAIDDQEEDQSGIASLLENILEMKENNEEGAEDAGEAQEAPAEAEAVGDKKQGKEDVKVEWQPLVQEGDLVEQGQPWGHFKVTREKKEDKNDKDANQAPQAAEPQDKAKGQKGAPPRAPKLDNKNKLQDGKGASWKMGEGAKPQVVDQGTGEKIDIPDNGEIKATHPMKIKGIGTTGELKPGDMLFTYENPKPEELEQKRKGKEGGEGREAGQDKEGDPERGKKQGE